MAEKDSLFSDTMDSLMKGMNGMLSTKTVVGEAIHIGDTIILPLVDVSFGVGAGAFQKQDSSNGGGGMGGKMSPSAVLVIQNGSTRLINVKEQDGITKLLDMVPDFVARFTGGHKKSYSEDAMECAKEEMEEMLDDSVN
ncbi:GerW family sporulation protein [Eubacterium oxidoreducens]|uniref:Uncharacterized spore protein YtfJ n=1 Tax=Eubacterium oxidoreducens TaxID=1732 RepID=A0A1G6AN88_EUBOX|nr:GerW family sporulation protein [Eubacterium oxidoreducens]SDB09633.1 Uncharacterized spore protein YtfJ [Eubacterium oxidoreducens]